MHRILLIPATAFLLLACSTGTDGGPAAMPAAATPPETAACFAEGKFRADLYGAVRARVDWHGSDLDCEGMPRPHGAGARLRFAGPVAIADLTHQLAFIVAVPDLEQGATAQELPATVTLIDEDNGRFFSSADTESCWADVHDQQPLSKDADSYAVSGIVYCVAPLAALTSNESIALRNLEFSGRVDWQVAD